MSRRSPNETNKNVDETRLMAFGNGGRIARLFIPASPASEQIRLPQQNPKRALARRRLGRLIDTRRVVS